MHGGGLYACGFAAPFLFLEAVSIIDDVKQVGLLFDGQVIEFALNFIIDSFKNTIQALMWPYNIVILRPSFGAIVLGLSFLVFQKYAEPHIEAWLFDDDEKEDDELSGEDPK